jgi:hypothetical protein
MAIKLDISINCIFVAATHSSIALPCPSAEKQTPLLLSTSLQRIRLGPKSQMFIGDPRYHPYAYHNRLGMNGMNGVLANGMGINGFAPVAINGLGVYAPNGPAVNGYLGEVGVDIGFGNGSPRPDLAINPAALLPNGGDTSSSQSPVSPFLNGTGRGSASASQLSSLFFDQSPNSSGFANGTVDFDIDEYLHFEDPDAVKIEEEIFGTKTE